jgi:hypothetical protein
MKRTSRDLEQGTGAPGIGAGSGGGGYRGMDAATARAAGQVQQSIKDRGGFPTSKGVPKMTRAQQKAEERKSSAPPVDEAARAARKAKFFSKGGMVRGRSDYAKCK